MLRNKTPSVLEISNCCLGQLLGVFLKSLLEIYQLSTNMCKGLTCCNSLLVRINDILHVGFSEITEPWMLNKYFNCTSM